VYGSGIVRKSFRMPILPGVATACDETTVARRRTSTSWTRSAGARPLSSTWLTLYRYGLAWNPPPSPVPSGLASWADMCTSKSPGALVRDGRTDTPS
jgi:hypothetical protein